MIARDGWPFVLASCMIGLILSGLILIIPGIPRWIVFVFIPLLLPGLGLMVAYFFRDPKRNPSPDSANLILAPADGKIVEIVCEDETDYIGGKVLRISIFLSILDVHVNRVPVKGIVRYINYKSGHFRVAWHPKASTENEQSLIGVEHSSGARILFKQIAGTLARRIVNRLCVGDRVSAGERFGLIRFGSRMDVMYPAHYPVYVKIGDQVTAGESILGVIDVESTRD